MVRAFSTMTPIGWCPSSSRGSGGQVAPAHEVVRGGAEGEDPIDEPAAAVPQLPEQRHGLQPAKRLLNEFPLAMTNAIARMSRRAGVDGAAAIHEFVLRHVRRDAHASDGCDPGTNVVRFVRGHRE